jgi:hypothetical protein
MVGEIELAPYTSGFSVILGSVLKRLVSQLYGQKEALSQ